MTLKKTLCLALILLLSVMCAVACGPSGDPNPQAQTPTVTKLTLNKTSINESCYVGDVFDISTLTGKAAFSNGTSKNLTFSDFTVLVNPDTSVAGTTTLTVSYGGKSASVDIIVEEPYVQSIGLSGLPRTLVWGSTIDVTQYSVVVKYSNGKSVTVGYDEAEANGLTVTVPNTKTTGEVELSLSYLGSHKTHKIEIIDPITEIRLINEFLSFEFRVGATRDEINKVLDSLVVHAIHTSGSYDVLTLKNLTIQYSDINVESATDANKPTFKVSYQGFELNASYSVKSSSAFKELTLDESNGFKMTYLPGESLSALDSLKVKISYVDENDADRTGVDITSGLSVLGYDDIDLSTPGEYDLTITYTEAGSSISVKYTVEVYGIESVTASGFDTSIAVGSNFDTTGESFIVTIKYTNGDVVSFAYGERADAPIIHEQLKLSHNVNPDEKGVWSVKVEYFDAYSITDVKVIGDIIPDADGDQNVTEKTPL